MPLANCGKCGGTQFDRVPQDSAPVQIDLIICGRCGAVLGATSVRHSARMEKRLEEVQNVLARIANKVGASLT